MIENEQLEEKKSQDELPVPWQRIQTAIWLIGLAIIAWQDWWWPGILVLAAVSGLTQGIIQLYLSRQRQSEALAAEDKKLAQERGTWLPDLCPNCGGPISVATVHWTGPNTADCPYCKANLIRPE